MNGRIAALVLAGLVLGGCATGKGINDAEDIGDDGERNTLLLSYSIRLDVTDRLPKDDSTRLQLRCDGGGALSGYPVCFGVDVPFEGMREEEGFVWHSFGAEGAQLVGMKYGQNVLARINFDVLIGQKPETSCYEDKKGRTRCSTRYVDEKKKFNEALPANDVLLVGPGRGCFAGHLELLVRGGAIVDYRLDRAPGEDVLEAAFEALPASFRAPARAHVDGPCPG